MCVEEGDGYDQFERFVWLPHPHRLLTYHCFIAVSPIRWSGLKSCQNCVKSLSGRQTPSLTGTRLSYECLHFLAAPENTGFPEIS